MIRYYIEIIWPDGREQQYRFSRLEKALKWAEVARQRASSLSVRVGAC